MPFFKTFITSQKNNNELAFLNLRIMLIVKVEIEYLHKILVYDNTKIS